MPSDRKRLAVVILADGARADVIGEELARGRLPNIARHLVEQGASLPAVTSFPSTTGPAYLPFLTGCFPGTCNVPGIRWFDKAKYDSGWSFDRYRSYVGLESFCMAGDMWGHIRTVFELVPGSVSIFNPIARGARGPRNATRVSRIWYWYYSHLTDRWAFTDEAALRKLRAEIAKRPSYVFCVFPGIDEYSHLAHPRHPRTLEQYSRLDSAVGAVVADLAAAGLWDETALFLVSDHGLSATHTHFCVNTFMEGRGLPPFFYPLIFKKRGKLCANMVSGNGMTHLYFRNRDGWARHTVRDELERLSPGLIDALLEEEAVDILAVRNSAGGADILSKRGEASARLDGAALHYEVKGSDPFGYGPLPADLDPMQSLARTLDTDYPDAPFQIAHLMTAPRAGDLIISATPGFDLREKYEHPEHRASHGSLHHSHMRVPLITNLRLEYRPARTADVFPTVLKLLGSPLPGHIDGLPLNELKAQR
ncbi:MAG: alkaline phosphatase family protein [Proteobacteria bacterium]|nr:alkaline phosphatase family protein [Pseudomonadota bacterium]